MMSTTGGPQKLTKKQKKGLAFRERKSGNRNSASKKKSTVNSGDDLEDGLIEMDLNAIPIMEDQDLAGLPSDNVEVDGDTHAKGSEVDGKKGGKDGKGKNKGKGKAGVEQTGSSAEVGKGQKRKRDEQDEMVDEVEGQGEKQTVKKRKKAKKDGEAEDGPDRTQRLILFVGNLKYTTTKEAIQAHFAVCEPPPAVRLLTPKPKPSVAARPKSKGCAFLEFSHKAGLQQALKLHQSMLEGRMINVELTAGGGGKSEARLKKVQERNKELLSQRKKHVEKAEKSRKQTDTILLKPERPQRYSATSGIDQALTTKRTWSVGDTVEEQTHRGGKKTRGAKKTNNKPWGTGVNAIPVG